jgi:hypothetical protein
MPSKIDYVLFNCNLIIHSKSLIYMILTLSLGTLNKHIKQNLKKVLCDDSMTRMTASREACWTRAAPDPRTLWRFGWTGEVMGELYPFVLKVLGVLMCTIAGLFLLANQRFQSRHLSENILDIRWTSLLTYINSSLLPYLSDSIPEVLSDPRRTCKYPYQGPLSSPVMNIFVAPVRKFMRTRLVSYCLTSSHHIFF